MKNHYRSIYLLFSMANVSLAVHGGKPQVDAEQPHAEQPQVDAEHHEEQPQVDPWELTCSNCEKAPGEQRCQPNKKATRVEGGKGLNGTKWAEWVKRECNKDEQMELIKKIDHEVCYDDCKEKKARRNIVEHDCWKNSEKYKDLYYHCAVECSGKQEGGKWGNGFMRWTKSIMQPKETFFKGHILDKCIAQKSGYTGFGGHVEAPERFY
jgi:hypothetical protein